MCISVCLSLSLCVSPTPSVGKGSTLAESRSAGDLAVLAYRRQRVLNDLRDPMRRAPFATHDAFLSKYQPGDEP